MYFVRFVIRILQSLQLKDISTFIINLLSLVLQMPEYVMSYFEALHKWNVGGGAWCIPRKGTILQKQLNMIRSGEIESKQDLVKKTIEEMKKKPKKEKKEKSSMKVKI